MRANMRDMALAPPVLLSPASRSTKRGSESRNDLARSSLSSPATNGRNLQSSTPTGTWYTTHRIGQDAAQFSAFPEPGASSPMEHIQSGSSNSSAGRSSTPPVSGKMLWMPDKSSKSCYDCHSSFTLFRRRHHCRLCGLIFCHKCSDHFINGTAYGYPRELIRVCNYCTQQVKEEAGRASQGQTTTAVSASPLLFSPVNAAAAAAYRAKGNDDDEAMLTPTPPPSLSPSIPSPTRLASDTSPPTSVPPSPTSSQPAAPAVVDDTPSSPKPPTVAQSPQEHAASPPVSPSSLSRPISPVASSPKPIANIESPPVSPPVTPKTTISPASPQPLSPASSLPASPRLPLPRTPPSSPQTAPIPSPLLFSSSDSTPTVTEKEDPVVDLEADSAVLQELVSELNDPIEEKTTETAEIVENCVELPHPPPLFTILSSDSTDLGDGEPTTPQQKPFPAKRPSLSRRRRSSAELMGAIESSGLLATEALPPAAEDAGPSDTRPSLKREDKSFRVKTDSHTQREIVLDKYMTAAHERIREGIHRSVDRVMKHFVGDGMEAKRLASSLEDVAFITTGHLLFSMNFRTDNGFNFAELVKVKSIAALPEARSPTQRLGADPYTFKWLAGCVVRKSLSHKQMARQIANPRIMLLACGISYDRSSDSGKLSSLDALIESEKSYIAILVDKISRLEPDVIFVEKTVSRHAQELLRERGVAIILNVKVETLERIGQYTGAAVLTSVDHLGQLNADEVIGSCRSFYAQTKPVVPDDDAVTEVVEGAAHKPIQRVGSRSKTDTHLYLDGCDPLNGCTVLISGASKKKLRILKEVARNVLSMTYRTLLEAHVLCDLGLGFSDWYRRSLVDAMDRMTWCTTCTLREFDAGTTSKQRYYQCSGAKQIGIAPYSKSDISLGNFLAREMEALSYRCHNSKCSYTMADHVQTFSCTIGTVTVSFEEVPEKVSSGEVQASGPAQNLLTLLTKLNGEPVDALPVSTTGLDEDEANCPTIVFGRWCRQCAVMISPFAPLKKYAYKYSLARLLEVLFAESDGQSPHNTAKTVAGASTCTHDFMKAHVLFFNVGRTVARMDFQRHHAVRLFNTPPFVVIQGVRRRRSTVSDRSDQLEQSAVFAEAVAKRLAMLEDLVAKLVASFSEKIQYIEGVIESCEDYDGVATELLIEVALLKKLVATDHDAFLKRIEGIREEEPAKKQLAESDKAKRTLYYVACAWIEEIQNLRKAIKSTLAIDAGMTASTFSLSAFSFSTPTSQSPVPSPRSNLPGSPRRAKRNSKTVIPEETELSSDGSSLNGAEASEGTANPLFASSSTSVVSSPAATKTSTLLVAPGSQSAPKSESKESTWRSVLWDMYKGMGKSSPGDNFDFQLPVELLDGHPSLSSRSNELVLLVNENVPITSVAYALGSQSYDEQLKSWKVTLQLTTKDQQAKPSECRELSAQAAVEWTRAALNAPLNMHFKHSVSDTPPHLGLLYPSGTGSVGCWDFSTIAFFPLQFEAVRELFYGELPEFLFSISHVKNWEALGGKSGASFFRTLDDRFVVKHISSTEQQSFLEVLPSYFKYMAKIYFEETASVISKIAGMYQTTITKKETGQRTTHHLIVMENAFYGHKVSRIFDLKGSSRNRYVKTGADGKPRGVQLDGNLIEMTGGHAIGVIAEDHEVLQCAINNDAEFLKSINIIDFSLVVGFGGEIADEPNEFAHMTVGIIDYLRQFDLIKRVESVSKSVGMIAGQSSPTIIEPALYGKRFCDAIGRYFMPVTPIDSDRNGPLLLSQ